MFDKNMVSFLDGTMLGMVLFVPILYLDGFGAISRGNYSSFQG